VLAAQAMFPVTSDAEMRGVAGDVDVNGQANDLSMVDPADVGGIWAGLMVRLMAIEGYVTLFAAAYPGVPTEELRFSHAANAIAAFEEHAFTLVNSPWDRYLRGESGAMSEAAKRGSVLFFGDASCGACHNGKLLTDQKPHCIGAPQVGPGKGEGAPHDLGAFLVSGKEAERYAFRTPPLRNVTETGPWMHDGAYTTLEAAVRHHLDAAGALSGYDPSQLRPDFEETYAFDQAVIDEMSANLDAKLAPARALSDAEVADLMAFLDALTDPAARNLAHLVPDTVPSGLPVDH
jgi:cytochrome c peroxidase